MTLSFLPQESLEVKFKAEESVDISLTARLNATSIEILDMTGTIEDTLRMNLNYKNGYLDSSLTYDDVSTTATCTLF